VWSYLPATVLLLTIPFVNKFVRKLNIYRRVENKLIVKVTHLLTIFSFWISLTYPLIPIKEWVGDGGFTTLDDKNIFFLAPILSFVIILFNHEFIIYLRKKTNSLKVVIIYMYSFCLICFVIAVVFLSWVFFMLGPILKGLEGSIEHGFIGVVSLTANIVAIFLFWNSLDFEQTNFVNSKGGIRDIH
jgi:hypothetical protein